LINYAAAASFITKAPAIAAALKLTSRQIGLVVDQSDADVSLVIFSMGGLEPPIQSNLCDP
jgi:hypothetical protein